MPITVAIAFYEEAEEIEASEFERMKLAASYIHLTKDSQKSIDRHMRRNMPEGTAGTNADYDTSWEKLKNIAQGSK